MKYRISIISIGMLISRNLSHMSAVLCLTWAGAVAAGYQPAPEVRGTWITTTANTHIATPADTANTMRRLREIGLNTVYVETWKNGYTQYPSQVLKDLIGVERRPDLIKMDPGDPDVMLPARDLLQETLIEAHRNGLIYIGWFEYGFMAAHQSTMNHLRTVKPDWLSRNLAGEEVAPNGFVWLNPLHPQARRFLLDIVLEAIDNYDMDGVQLDDRIVWPHVTMGYDDYTRAVYANEHGGAQPPEDHKDPQWMAWRSKKVDEYAQQFVEEVRARRPGLIVSVSPAPFPWVYENYCLDWPAWAAAGLWDEYIPQCYRYDYPAFKNTWDQQLDYLRKVGGKADPADMLAGVLTTGSQPDPVPWEDLRQSIDHVRATGGGGHVWWFSRGVLDEYPNEIAAYYDVQAVGHASHPKRSPDWRPGAVNLRGQQDGQMMRYSLVGVPHGQYHLVLTHPSEGQTQIRSLQVDGTEQEIAVRGEFSSAELLIDRRPDMQQRIDQ